MQLLNLLKQRHGSRTLNFMSISIFRRQEKQLQVMKVEKCISWPGI